MSLELQKLDAPFGAAVIGIDLREAQHAVDELEDALAEHSILLFPRQSLNDEEVVAASALFGEVDMARNLNARSPVTDRIYYISNLKNEKGVEIGQHGTGEVRWHSDHATHLRPATLSLLYCVEAPHSGGNTHFCSTVLGYAALPEALRERIAGRFVVYSNSARNAYEKGEMAQPLVLEQPRSGKRSLYLGQGARYIEGMPEEESTALIQELLSYQLRPEHTYQHPWHVGDLVVYDNHQVLHRRDPFTGIRLMKGTRVFASPEKFAKPQGTHEPVSPAEPSSPAEAPAPA